MGTGDIVILVSVFGGVMALFVAVGLLLQGRSSSAALGRLQASARRVAAPVPAEILKAGKRRRQTGESFWARVVRPMSALWRFGDTSQSQLQELLVHAGIREKGAVEVFLGAKFALAVALPAAVVAFFLWRSASTGVGLNYRTVFMCAVGALVGGLMAPIVWLRRKARARIDTIRMSLPDALDLLIVCVESGLGLDAALLRISQEMQEVAPELSEDLVLLNLEVAAGKPRSECLRNLALRTGSEEVESLTARINQAAKYGTNLGHSLRIHSESLRQKRRQEAEERAAKTSVKLLFPLVFFIFPAIFVVILGPAMIDLRTFFSK
jgi:tight adherence protein C